MKKRIYHFFGRIRSFLLSPVQLKISTAHDAMIDNRLEDAKLQVARVMPDNLLLKGFKAYSACEEDGIIQEIFRRINSSTKVFVEIGCGKGIENNTHFLLLNGWKGTWIDGDDSFIQYIQSTLGALEFNELLVRKCFVTTGNVVELFQTTTTYFKATEVDFFSLDIDGNDFHLLEAVLAADFLPKAVCVEYNPKLAYPCDIKVAYSENNIWQGDDYMGASLGAWVNIFNRYNYTLVCCDISGNNAFFVRNQYAALFTIYQPEQLFQPSRYYLSKRRSGHLSTLKFLKNIVTPK